MGVKNKLKCSEIIWNEKYRDFNGQSILYLYPVSRGCDICVETRETVAKAYENCSKRKKCSTVWLSHYDMDYLIETFVEAHPDPYICSLPYWQEWGIVPYGY